MLLKESKTGLTKINGNHKKKNARQQNQNTDVHSKLYGLTKLQKIFE